MTEQEPPITTWHHGLMARWWAEFVEPEPEELVGWRPPACAALTGTAGRPARRGPSTRSGAGRKGSPARYVIVMPYALCPGPIRAARSLASRGRGPPRSPRGLGGQEQAQGHPREIAGIPAPPRAPRSATGTCLSAIETASVATASPASWTAALPCPLGRGTTALLVMMLNSTDPSGVATIVMGRLPRQDAHALRAVRSATEWVPARQIFGGARVVSLPPVIPPRLRAGGGGPA